ncbi:gamma-glutamylcyclotransferase [Neobacillus thermocopriae]|uniref:Gamma-glutamylcyclotransferase family protein n=1 Tax=Neobacillus thermocopriae TaxID=1215031 RepID=A0A6B3TPF3_9BACI|nr:gamma-glutamylcyclotransferase family protein [Neobacillus thermocopriae]MED3623948.1 gamma-glutamylcyclotransferase [Neobacillus thermocopriae]MED3713857.1 gamma-glutamylcyclotransferase [Neobacillus thermocopriae]NEX78001.1 gamma-glutamylcyclotransferase [Neobacillus thermocopriae]
MKQHYVFVYGTLRRHDKYHDLLKDSVLISEQAWTKGRLYDTEDGYPALMESTEGTVYGELYLVTDEQLSRLDRLEEYEENRDNNLYDRKKKLIYHDRGETEAYTYFITKQNEFMLKIAIPSGDWRIYQFEKQKGNVLYYAYGSCMDHARFKKANVDHYFQKLIGRGILEGYSLRFTKKLPDGGRADIVENGGIVEGKVYEVPRECLDYLYQREGVEIRLYRPALIDVKMDGQIVKDVLTFIVVDKEPETAPPDHYLEEIIRGGRGILSEMYISRLIEHVRTLA